MGRTTKRWILLAMMIARAIPAPSAALASAELRGRIDPRLLPYLEAPGGDSIAVWTEFRDKGEDGPADLARRLAEADALLTPRARARRVRAHVHPLVDERDLPVEPRYLAELAALGVRPIAVSRWLNRAAVRLPSRQLAGLAGLECVARVTPVEKATRISMETGPAARIPARSPGQGAPRRSDSLAPESPSAIDYGLTRDPLLQVRIPAVHTCGYTGRGVLIAILDEGFPGYDVHEALRDRVLDPGFTRDFVEGDVDVTNGFLLGHGTWVLGLIAGNRSGRYVGAAFGARFALARTENFVSESPAEMLYWGMGAEWADSLGADIINSSVGYFNFDDPQFDYGYSDMDGHTTDVTRAAEIAAAKGLLVVAAVGNEGQSPWRRLIAPSDANGDSVLTIGAVDAFGDTAAFSSVGPTADGRIKPDLVALGVAVPLVAPFGPGDTYESNNGTSFAAPLVTGLAACLMEAHPDSTPVAIIRALRASASRASAPDDKVGYGLPDGLLALHGVPSGVPKGALFHVEIAGENPVRVGPARVSFGTDDPGKDPFEARLVVFDAQGRHIRDLWSGLLCYGESETADWDGRRDDGHRAGPGLYFMALVGEGHVQGVRIVSLR